MPFTVENSAVVYHGPFPKDLTDAFRLSIQKWELVRDYEDAVYDGGTHTCALCMLFVQSACEGCPIAEETDQIYCGGFVEYNEWMNAKINEFNETDPEIRRRLVDDIIDKLKEFRDGNSRRD